MKKVLLSLAVVFGFFIYALASKSGKSTNTPAITPSTSGNNSSSQTGGNSNSTSGMNSNSNMNSNMMSGSYKNGTFTGTSADAFYGNVQVQVVIAGGKITDVKFLDYPQDRRNSVEINSQAMPYLIQETIQAQSANVDMISGATATSQAFVQSLTSALQQAS